MRDGSDAVRSVRRYVASALGSPPWRVRLAMDGRFKRPSALIHTPLPSPRHAAGPRTARMEMQMIIQLFPLAGASGTESQVLAEQAADLVLNALDRGVADMHDPTVRGYQQRIPLWDYTDQNGDPLPVESGRATRRTEHDYLLVADGFTKQTMPMAPDDQLFTAIIEMTVRWYRNAGWSPPAGPPLAGLRVTPAAAGGE